MSLGATSVRRCLLYRHALSNSSVCAGRGLAQIRWSSTSTRQWSTPLAKSLAEAITTTGPISIAKYMRQCLTSLEGGYYTTRNAEGQDQFGKSGDFVTSPEISQIFGELVGIWFVTEWMAQGRINSGVQLIELGPGRGTLMDDVLRTITNFKAMASALDTIYLVEASPLLREIQKERLCGPQPLEDHAAGKQAICKRLHGLKVVWVEDIKFLPKEANKTPLIIAHEFFDALPIHAFQSVTPKTAQLQAPRGLTTSTSSVPPTPSKPSNEWRELLVSPSPPPSVINPPKQPGPEFELTTSPVPTNYSRLLPALSTRYAKLLPRSGSTIEISPESQTTMSFITELISGEPIVPPQPSRSAVATTRAKPSRPPPRKPRASGAALVVDYGPLDTIPVSTLRGIRSHQMTSPFSAAGQVDLSVDVDFGALVETALNSSENVEVHGPVLQADWLESMGGRERCDALVRRAKAGTVRAAGAGDGEVATNEAEEIAKRVGSGWDRLVDRNINGMGKLYKAMAVVPLNEGIRRPVGFGGGVL